MVEVRTNQFTIEFVAQAADFVQQALVVFKNDLVHVRRELFVFMGAVDSTVMNASVITHVQNDLAKLLESFYSSLQDKLITWLHDGIRLGAEMVLSILPTEGMLLPDIDDIFQYDIFELMVLDKLQFFITSLKTDCMQRLYQGVLNQELIENSLMHLLRLFPETDAQVRGMYTWRLKTIVCTEVGRAISEGTQAMLDVASLYVSNLRKQWCCTSRVGRSGHKAVDGTIVQVAEMFRVAPFEGQPLEAMRFPRDLSASALNTVNCGCIMVPIIIGVE